MVSVGCCGHEDSHTKIIENTLRACQPHSFLATNLTANYLTANLHRGHGKLVVKFAVKFGKFYHKCVTGDTLLETLPNTCVQCYYGTIL